MAPIFDREEVLANPLPPAEHIGPMALEFAVLGHIDLAHDLFDVVNREYPMNSLDSDFRPLSLAWQVAGKWPTGSTKFENEEERKVYEYTASGSLWPDGVSEDDLVDDEKALKRVLEIFRKTQKFEDDKEELVDIEDENTKSTALAKALELSLNLAEKKAGKSPLDQLDAQSQGILKQISERLHRPNQSEALAICVPAWPYLAKGALAEAVGAKSEKIEALGKTIKDTISEWFSHGPRARAPSNKSLKELLEVCSSRSKILWDEESDEPAPETLFASSGASDKDVADLESKLEIEIPADYKEFLAISNGFKRILADDSLFEDYQAPLHPVSEVAWRKADEFFGDEGEDDYFSEDDDEGYLDNSDSDVFDVDEDEDDFVKNGGRPAKKMKLADGAEAATKRANDKDEDEEDEVKVKWDPGAIYFDLLDLPFAAHVESAKQNGGKRLEIEKAVVVGADEDERIHLLLLPPEQVRKVRDTYVRTIDNSKDEDLKKVIRWAMVAFAGSEEAFRKFDDWVFAAWDEGEIHCWASFRRYIEELSDACLKTEEIDDQESFAKKESLAYSCR